MTDQNTELLPIAIEADEVELPQQDAPTRPIAQQAPKRQNEYVKAVRMRITDYVPQPMRAWSKTAGIAAIMGFLVFWTLGLTAIPAVVLGHIGIIKTRRQGRGRWLAVVGLVLGYGTIALFALLILGGLLYYVFS